MKKLGMLLLMAVFLSACGNVSPSKSLVVYYSNNDEIEALATQIAKDSDSELFQIVPKKRLLLPERENRKRRGTVRFRNRGFAVDQRFARTKRSRPVEPMRHGVHRISGPVNHSRPGSRIRVFEPEQPQK